MACRIVPASLQYVNFGSSNILNVSGTAFSMIGRVYPTAYTGGGRVLCRAKNSATGQFIQYVFQLDNSPRAIFFLDVSGVLRFTIASGFAYPLNTWSTFACTYDGSTMRMYRNAEVTPISTANFSGSISSLTGADWELDYGIINYAKGASTQHYQGDGFDFRVCNTVLSQTDIATYHNSGGCDSLGGAVGRWKFDLESGTVSSEPDLSGNGNNGIGVNSPAYVSDPFDPCGAVGRQGMNRMNTHFNLGAL